MSSPLKEFNKNWWIEVYNRIIGAIVFIDDCTAESLHWDGGLFNLLQGGAVGVKSLSPFEFGLKEQHKAVFLTQATSNQLQSIKDIVSNSNFTHCILISCASLDVVYLELNEGKDVTDVITSGKAVSEATKELERMLKDAIGKEQYAVEVIYIPLFSITPTNVLFLTPPYHNMYPKYEGRLKPDSNSVDLYSLSHNERSAIRRLAGGLNSLFESLSYKEEIFYMGQLSSLLAGVLENSPVCIARKKTCTTPISLVIIDRTLDLCGVTSHSTESVMDRMIAVLPRFPGHSNEVAVDMTPLCQVTVVSHPDDIQMSPGCVYHANDDSCLQTYDYMINKSQKEVMLDLYNKLSKLDLPKSPGLKTLLKVTPQSVEKLVAVSKGNNEIICNHAGILQQALGVVQMIKSPNRSQFDLVTSLEKQVIENLAASRESTSVLHQLSHLIKSRKDRGLQLENLLALLVHVYSLTGAEVVFNKQHEDQLQETLSVAIFEDHKTLLTNVETGHIVTPEECEQISINIMSDLKTISQMRNNLQRYNSVLKQSENGVGHEYRGVLQQLVDDLVNTERPDLPDLRHRNEGIKDLLRSGLNILTSKKARGAKHPLDNQTVIVFVIGGITADECKQLNRSVITSGIDNNVIIGSTKFVNPVDAMRDVLTL
ncbi:sec1 family domain-containing protein 2-like [Leptidea sinapis]|uniref:sec1 family domain-containing protein 2-like n=1 Tax=Leptidea sinapis TaxID=189913 RepID=UPI002129FC9A|nr:sec1 family domain-containing protein 2-like [Leptidea sinapis]